MDHCISPFFPLFKQENFPLKFFSLLFQFFCQTILHLYYGFTMEFQIAGEAWLHFWILPNSDAMV